MPPSAVEKHTDTCSAALVEGQACDCIYGTAADLAAHVQKLIDTHDCDGTFEDCLACKAVREATAACNEYRRMRQ